MLLNGLMLKDSAFLQKMADKYKDVIKANEKPQHTQEVRSPREFMQALNNRRK